MSKPTTEQIERGLTDSEWRVRWEFAKRTDFTPTPVQVERGLMDSDENVREVFEKRQAEWTAKWEAKELKERHATVVAAKPKTKAL